jgi:hypothetical protein
MRRRGAARVVLGQILASSGVLDHGAVTMPLNPDTVDQTCAARSEQ